MAAVANLLRLPGPVNFQLSRPAGPEQSSLALLAGVRVPLPQVGGPPLMELWFWSCSNLTSAFRAQRAAGGPVLLQLEALVCRKSKVLLQPLSSPPSFLVSLLPAGVRVNYIQHGGSAAARPQCCSFCKVLLGNGVRVIKEFKQVTWSQGQPEVRSERRPAQIGGLWWSGSEPTEAALKFNLSLFWSHQEGQSRPGPSLVFCSPNCSALHTSGLQSSAGTKVSPSAAVYRVDDVMLCGR